MSIEEARHGGPSNGTGMPAQFAASGLVAGNPAQTSVTGVVLDNSNLPIPGVTMHLLGLSQGTNGNVPIDVVPAVQTDSQGQFTLTQAPIGVFKLMADGTTAAVGTKKYPTLEFDVTTVAGRSTGVGTPIYLQNLDTVNQLCVTATTGGTLTLPDSPGFSLTVAPGSATFPGGSRSGCISATPVHMDKIPMAPGFGQQPRFILTIQPVGTTFNPPAAMTLPNVDGLAPRAVTEMYSYDHDLGSFVAIGTGTVSNDGTLIVSDPGVGVLKAGWHCGGPPVPPGCGCSCGLCQLCLQSIDNSCSCVADPSCSGNPPGGPGCSDQPPGPVTTTTYQLNQVQQISQVLQVVLSAVNLSAVSLPQVQASFTKTSQDLCCSRTQDFREKATVQGTIQLPASPITIRPQLRPWMGTYEASFLGTTVGIGYGVQLQVTPSINGSLQNTADYCPDPPSSCWQGSLFPDVELDATLFGELDAGLPSVCGKSGNGPCSLVKINAGGVTDIKAPGQVSCNAISFDDIEWSGLNLAATVAVLEGTGCGIPISNATPIGDADNFTPWVFHRAA